jgi:hypothetical protein
VIEGIAGTAGEMTQEERDQETSTHHLRISSMDHATYITHTLTAPDERLQDVHEITRSNGIQPS